MLTACEHKSGLVFVRFVGRGGWAKVFVFTTWHALKIGSSVLAADRGPRVFIFTLRNWLMTVP